MTPPSLGSEPARRAGASDPVAASAWRFALGIGLVYALFGVAWIVFSDAWVLSLSSDPGWLALAQRTKGLFYVGITAAGLVVLVLAGYGRLLRAAAHARAHELEGQRRLQRQEAQFRQLHHSLAEVLWLASADGTRMLYLSPAFETLFGRPVADYEGQAAPWLDAVHPDDRGRPAACAATLSADGHCLCEYRICRPDGSVRWIADRRRTILDEGGRVAMIGGIVEDITDRKERDAQLERMVADRTAALERANGELEAFSRTVAHDLKSPLGAIVGYAQLLQMRHAAEFGDDATRMLDQIAQSAWHMTSLVNDLLALSVVAHAQIEPGEVDLARLAREIIDDLRRQEPQRRVRFESPPELVVCCDAGLARSLMANVLGNAWKFSARRDEASIRLSSKRSDNGTMVLVEDNGAGFDVGGGANLFKPFHRFHSASEFSGTGIGLATCARIVGRHGGRIWIESTPGRGTTLGFVLPDFGCSHPVPLDATLAGA